MKKKCVLFCGCCFSSSLDEAVPIFFCAVIEVSNMAERVVLKLWIVTVW